MTEYDYESTNKIHFSDDLYRSFESILGASTTKLLINWMFAPEPDIYESWTELISSSSSIAFLSPTSLSLY